jgi:integrase
VIGVNKRVLIDAEMVDLLAWMPNFSRVVSDALELYLWTACRGAEIVVMERHEIIEEASGLWWTVPVAKLKMRRNPLLVDRRVPLIGRAEAIVRRRMAAATKGTWLFPSVGQYGHVEVGPSKASAGRGSK